MERVPDGAAIAREILIPLKAALARSLPGESAHRSVLPTEGEARVLPPGTEVQSAAVLLALSPGEGDRRIRFPLIRRPDSMLRHAGQVSLPGGVLDEAENPEACALREAFEEIGLEPESVRILGRLTPIVIPVSRFRVETVLGWVDSSPALRPQEREVLRIVHADPDRLVQEGPTETVERHRDGQSLRFPAYHVEGEIVWGATALILSEFLEIWRRIRAIGSSRGS